MGVVRSTNINKGESDMRTRQLISVLLIILMVLSVSSCSKVADKIAEKGVEAVMENATGADVDISKDGTEIKVDGGSIQAGDDLKWPKDAMGELPEPKGKITFVMVDEGKKGGTIALSDMEKEEAQKYIEKLKEMGFKDGMSMQDEEGYYFGGTKENGETVNFSYNIDAKESSLIFGIAQQ